MAAKEASSASCGSSLASRARPSGDSAVRLSAVDLRAALERAERRDPDLPALEDLRLGERIFDVGRVARVDRHLHARRRRGGDGSPLGRRAARRKSADHRSQPAGSLWPRGLPQWRRGAPLAGGRVSGPSSSRARINEAPHSRRRAVLAAARGPPSIPVCPRVPLTSWAPTQPCSAGPEAAGQKASSVRQSSLSPSRLRDPRRQAPLRRASGATTPPQGSGAGQSRVRWHS